MNCPNCGAETHPGQRFCASCGTRLDRACTNCSAPLPDGARFCPECGTPVAGSRQSAQPATPPAAGAAETAGGAAATAPRRPAEAPTVERRHVSVLFVDLVGYTDLATRLDPEETREFQSAYFALAREVVERYGGTIEKFIGDAVMAVWGAPVSTEDDPERAVRACIDLVTAVPALPAPAQLSARGGVSTGETAVTFGADGEGMVTGDTVNLAARLQAAADPGSVLTDDATRRAAEAAIAFESLGQVSLKGFAQPVPAWRADRVVAGRAGHGRTDEIEAPFVGRSAEIALLKELFHATARERRLRVVSVTGHAGLGKSRLAWEFEKYVDGITGDVYWHQGRSPAYGEGITFWALGEMVRRRAGIVEVDDDQTTIAKLRETLATHVPDESERVRIEPSLRILLGIEGVSPAERGELFGAWRTLFERMADRAPVVLVFEDLQWADGGLVDFVSHLLEWSRQQPIFVVTLARPELLERFPSWGAGQRNFTSLHLEPLGDEDMRELLAGLVPGLPAGTVRAILRRAEGVPLYAVETVRMLVADGALVRDNGTYRVERTVDDVSIPASLHALVAARLDALPAPDRALVQQAAVLGSSFSVDGLAAVTGRPADDLRADLERLVAREIVRLEADPRSPERGQYQFVQAVIREVAYQTLTRKDRKERHLAAARFFEALGDDELAGALARHYLDAWRAAGDGPDAGVLAAQARVALRGAAERAIALHSYEQALAFVTSALDVASDEVERADLSERASLAAWHAARFEESERLLRQAIDLQAGLGAGLAAARLRLQLGFQLVSTGRLGEALAELDAGRGLVPSGEDGAAAVALGYQAEIARARFLKGEHVVGIEMADEAIATAERLDSLPILVDALITKGSALTYIRPREGQATLFGAIELADRYGLTRAGLRARNNLASPLNKDDPAASLQLVRECLAMARRLGRRDEVTWFLNQVCFRCIEAGEMSEAAGIVGELLADETTPQLIRVFMLVNGAILAMIEGDLERAAARLGEVEASRGGLTNPEFEALVLATRAQLARFAGDLDGAAQLMAEAIERDPASDIEWQCELGRTYARLGRIDDAAATLERMKADPGRGRVIDAMVRHVEAAIAAAEGRRDEGTAMFLDVIGRYRAVGRVLDAANAQLEAALMLGIGDPAIRDEAVALRETCAVKGWRGFLGLLEPAFDTGAGPATAEVPAAEAAGETGETGQAGEAGEAGEVVAR